jgi:hypothetical protein
MGKLTQLYNSNCIVKGIGRMDEDMDEKELIKYLNLMPQSKNHNFSWFTNHFEEITEDQKLALRCAFRGERYIE